MLSFHSIRSLCFLAFVHVTFICILDIFSVRAKFISLVAVRVSIYALFWSGIAQFYSSSLVFGFVQEKIPFVYFALPFFCIFHVWSLLASHFMFFPVFVILFQSPCSINLRFNWIKAMARFVCLFLACTRTVPLRVKTIQATPTEEDWYLLEFFFSKCSKS